MLCGLQLKRRATFLLEAHEEAERRRIEAEARAKQEQDDLEAGRPRRMSMARRASERLTSAPLTSRGHAAAGTAIVDVAAQSGGSRPPVQPEAFTAVGIESR